MDRKKQIMHEAGNSFAAVEMRKYFRFDRWENDPEIRKDNIDVELDGSCLKKLEGEIQHSANPPYKLDLCGKWRLSSDEIDIEAAVPGSIHTACMEAGVIKDPYVGKNDAAAMELSGREWIYEKDFVYEGKGEDVRLHFDGVCDRCEVYLNGQMLGFHQGMFGGPFFDVTNIINKGQNKLKVKLLPAIHFTQTVVFNCSDGWHYARIWPLGIWNKVCVYDVPYAYSGSPFISTYDSVQGTLDLSMPVTVKSGRFDNCKIKVIVMPKNFIGNTYTFDCEAKEKIYIRFDMPEFKLWWPNGRGEQNLYTLYVQIINKETEEIISEKKSSFGIRKLEMKPYPSGEKPDIYNRTVTINGEGIFMKGAGWCTIDALMRFDRKAYERILSRAKQQGINFFRAWGGGLAETDEFYDMCDEYGICVYQEWPCCWDSQAVQPKEALYECVRLNTIRMRNHPSLVLYGGGNEGRGVIEDEALNEIGRKTYEYDGTRTFYRQDGGVGAAGMTHDHIHWGGETPEHYISRYGYSNEKNIHEYGLDSFMNMGSVKKYASKVEMLTWPIEKFGTVAHHTATFNGEYGWGPTPYGHDIDAFKHYASMFIKIDNITKLCIGSQMAQAMAKAPCIVNSRIKWPGSTVNVYYKMNDIYPGAAWSVVDWYGAPKIAHYICQDAQAPLMACGFMDRYNTYDKDDGNDLNVPVYLLDDNILLPGKSWRACVKVFGSELSVVSEKTFEGSGGVGKSGMIGVFHVNGELMENGPSFIVFDLYVDDKFASRYFMPLNFDNRQGCLFKLPKAEISVKKVLISSESDNEEIKAIESKNYKLPDVCRFNMSGIEKTDKAYIIKNISEVPAAYVHFICPDREDSFICSDNYFWLMPGESKVVYVDDFEGVEGAGCFNYSGIEEEMSIVKRVSDACIEKTSYVSAVSENCRSVTLKWKGIDANNLNIIAYSVYLGDTLCACTRAEKNINECIIEDLKESEKYTFEIYAVDEDLKEYAVSEKIEVEVLPDKETPKVLNVSMRTEESVEITFSKEIDISDAQQTLNYSIDDAEIISADIKEEYKDRVILKVKNNAAEHLHGRKIRVKGIHDTARNRNVMENTETVVFGQLTEDDFDNAGGLTSVMTGFSIGNGARIFFKVKSRQESRNTFRVLMAKGTKGDKIHFEFYINSQGVLCMFSNKGDHELGINIDNANDFCDIEIICRNNTTDVYCNGTKVKTLQDALMRTEAYGMMTLYSLNDGGLRFDGELKDVAMYSWF